jgi:hypothetical protein
MVKNLFLRNGQEGICRQAYFTTIRISTIKKARFLTWPVCFNGAGNGIRTRDFDLGKVALYH